jgi:hypothetical protein
VCCTYEEFAREEGRFVGEALKSAFLDCAAQASSPSSNSGRSPGRKWEQTASESAPAEKVRETAAARQASGGDVREITAARSSSGRRSMSPAACASLEYGSISLLSGNDDEDC